MTHKHQEGDFLWIYKDGNSENLGRSQYAETHRILSHVRKKRPGQNDKGQAWTAYASSIEMDAHSAKSATTTLRDTRVLVRRTKPSQRTRLGPQASQTKAITAVMDHEASSPSLSLRYPCYNSLDPFHSTALGMSATTSMSVIGNSVSSRISRITFLAEALAPPHLITQHVYLRHDKFRLERLKACVNSELLMCSSIAHGFSSLAWFDGNIGEGKSQYFLTKTLAAVRASLSRADTEFNKPLVLSIYTLAISELWNAFPNMWQGEWQYVRPLHLRACRMHLTALLVLIRQAGGWSTVSPYVLEGMLLMDRYAAMFDMSKPIIPLSWDPGPTPPELRIIRNESTSRLQYLGCGFEGLDIGTELLDVLQGMAIFIHIAVSAWKTTALSANAESWLYLRLHIFYHRMLLCEHQTDTEYTVKIATLIAQSNILAYPGGKFFAQVLLDNFRTALECSAEDLTGPNVDLRLWCLFTGALTKGESSHRAWFIDQLAVLIDECSLPLQLDTMSLKLQAYFYVPDRQDSDLSALLAVLRNRRRSEYIHESN